MAKTVKLELSVVGIRFRVTPTLMEEISEACPLRASIKRDLDNHHDGNAVAVAIMEKPWRKFHIGYLPRPTAQEIGPRMDREEVEVIEAWLTGIDTTTGVGELLLKVKVKGKSLQIGT